jgi:hypothetical protein
VLRQGTFCSVAPVEAHSCPQTLELYRKRTGATVSVILDHEFAFRLQPFEGSRSRLRRMRCPLWDFNRFWLGSYWKEEYLRVNLQIEVHRFDHEVKAANRLIVTRGDNSSRAVSNLRAACFEHAKASAARAASFKRACKTSIAMSPKPTYSPLRSEITFCEAGHSTAVRS